MASLPAVPAATGGGEAARLSAHLHHCELARGRFAPVGNALEVVRALLLGHIVSSVLLLTGLALAVAWLVG